jgi:hypothetical protein
MFVGADVTLYQSRDGHLALICVFWFDIKCFGSKTFFSI